MGKSCFKNIAILCLLFAGSSLHTNAQIYIKGLVVNTEDEPVAGATINVISHSWSTISNLGGEFELSNMFIGDSIRISSQGFISQNLIIKDSAQLLKIVLERSLIEQMEEVVVNTGYQKLPKERATGSFVVLDSSALNQQVGTNILKRLSNVTSGLQINTGRINTNPDNKTNLTIRGLSTINGPLDPLIVLDGFIYDGDIANINPSDVNNISVLKDAAASSIWGARAGNGVIVITTKKGKRNQRPNISASANFIMSNEPDLKSIPQLNSGSYIEIEQLLFNSGYFNSTINSKYRPITPAVEIFLKRRNGIISAQDSAMAIDKLKQVDVRDQYSKLFYTAPFTQQYFLNINGGGVNNSYNFSISNDQIQDEQYQKTSRTNMKMDNTFYLNRKLTLSVNAYYTYIKGQAGARPEYNSITINSRKVPYLTFVDENGNALPIARYFNNSYLDTVGNAKLLDWHYYPATDYLNYQGTTNTTSFFGTAALQYKILSFLSLKTEFQYQRQQSKVDNLSDENSYNARNLINLYSQLDRKSGVVTYNIPLGGILISTMNNTQTYTLRSQFNVDKKWKTIGINMILGSEMRELNQDANRESTYGYYKDPLTYTSVNYNIAYPTFITGSRSYIPANTLLTNSVSRFVSFFGNGSFSFQNKYILSASMRRDGSNIFGVETNDKWKPLWSVGGMWKICNEGFFNSSLFSMLNIRATYGYSGNVDLSKSALAIGRYVSTYSGTGLPYARITTLNNPNLRWEKTGMFNLGVDFELKSKILSGSIEYYRKKGTDLYGDVLYDYTAWGYTNTLVRNVAEMKGRGVDISLNANLLNRKVIWGTQFLFNYNRSITTKYDNQVAKDILSLVSSGLSISPYIGKSLYSIAAYRWGGLNASGNPQGYANDTLSTDYQLISKRIQEEGINSRGIVYVGSSVPTFSGALINTISYNRLSLTFNISYKAGYYFRKSSINYSGLISTGAGHPDYEKRWKSPGDEAYTNVPSFIYPANSSRDAFYNASEINVLKGDNIRFEFLNLSYDLLLKKTAIPKKVTVSANLSNVGILWRKNKAKLDPDYPDSVHPPLTISGGFKLAF
jgi:TonB-linked SusC/RagA family outer membrane protein